MGTMISCHLKGKKRVVFIWKQLNWFVLLLKLSVYLALDDESCIILELLYNFPSKEPNKWDFRGISFLFSSWQDIIPQWRSWNLVASMLTRDNFTASAPGLWGCWYGDLSSLALCQQQAVSSCFMHGNLYELKKRSTLIPRTEGSPLCIWLQGLETVHGISPAGAERHQTCSHGFRAFSSHTVISQGAWFCRAHFPTSLTLWLLSCYCDKVDETLLSLLLCAQPRKSHMRCFLWLSYKHVAQVGLTACIDLRSKMGYFQFLISICWGLHEWGDGISLKGVMHKPQKWKYKFLKTHMFLKLWA